MTIIFGNPIQRWDEVLLSVSKIPSNDVLESLYKLRVRESDATQHRIGIERHGNSSKDIDARQSKIEKKMVKRKKDQKLRLRNSDAGHGRIESGAVVQSRKGLIGVEGGKGICYQWKEKGQCSKGDRCNFRHETQDRVQNPEHTAATPSGPTVSRGRSASRKRSIRGKGNHGSIPRQPCRYYLRGTCTRTPCEYWRPPECQFYNTKTVCKSGDTWLFPHYKVDEQPMKKKTQERPLFHKRRESDDKDAVAIVKSVSHLGCVSPCMYDVWFLV